MDLAKRQDFAHVFWIGGSPCSGKSTIARTLAAKYGLQLYQTDALEARPVSPERQPMMHYLSSLGKDELWLRPVPLQVSTELEYCGSLKGLRERLGAQTTFAP